ncbi:MAG: tetratricopeptide repeat protein [Bacteroidaceae bacterium]|nr:tetratricopeptide repeat protein [Bacteroidaceae bacterium]
MRLDDDLKYFEEPEFKDILARYEAAREAGNSLYMDADDLTDVAEYYAMVCHDDERANEAIELALQLHPDAVDPQVFVARQLMQKGDNDGARKACDAIEDQQHREVSFLRGELLVREQKAEDAFNYLYQLSLEVEEDRDYFLYDSANIFIDYREFEPALKLAEELEKIAPNWFRTWELQADIQLGLEHYDVALPFIEKMLDKDPFYVDAWNWSTEAYCGLAQFEKAMECTDFALAVAPDNERAKQLKAWIYLQQGNFNEAHRIYKELQTTNPDCELHFLYDSYCMLDADDTEAALRLIEQAEEISGGMSPEQVVIYEQHAHVLSVLHDLEQALDYIDLAEQQNSEKTAIDYDLFRARIYAENGQPGEAIGFIQKCMMKDEKSAVQTYFQGAQIMFDTDYSDAALHMFLDIIEHTEDEALRKECYAYVAVCYHDQHKPELVLEYIRKAIDSGANNLKDVMGFLFNENVTPNEYFDYYYYEVYGQWPDAPLPF